MRSSMTVASCWLAAICVGIAGCGSTETTGHLSGTVTLDGKPLEAGTVLLTPADGSTRTSGCDIKDGHYEVEAPVGLMKVSLSAPKVTGKKKLYPTADSPEMPITVELLPARYNEKTELTVDVKPGKTQKDFELKGQ